MSRIFLETEYATSRIWHKWKQQSGVDIYLEESPQNSCNVALVFNHITGLFRLQFHVKYNPYLHTVQQLPPQYQWQIKA